MNLQILGTTHECMVKNHGEEQHTSISLSPDLRHGHIDGFPALSKLANH